MDTFPTDDGNTFRWLPPWRSRSEAMFAVVVIHTAKGAALNLETQEPSTSEISPWLAKWLAQYVLRAPEDVRQAEAEFIYMLGVLPLCEPNGEVIADAGVIEVGHGSDPVGPPGGVSVSFEELADQMRRLLE